MAKSPNLDAIREERVKAEALLAEIRQREKEAEAALRDAGRPMLIAALDRVKIADMERAEAKTIADAIAKHGGAKVAAALSGIAS